MNGLAIFWQLSVQIDFSYLGGIVGQHLNGVAKCLERLRTRVQGSLEGFCMYTHYGHVGTILT